MKIKIISTHAMQIHRDRLNKVPKDDEAQLKQIEEVAPKPFEATLHDKKMPKELKDGVVVMPGDYYAVGDDGRQIVIASRDIGVGYKIVDNNA